MRLRIRHAGGMATLSEPTPEQTVEQLKQAISKAIGLGENQGIESKIYNLPLYPYLLTII